MFLRRLEIENFFSFGDDVTVDFDRIVSPTLVKGLSGDAKGSNGAGKSALFEAVFWCLTGKTVRGVKADSVVRTGQKKVRVKVRFLWDVVYYEVERVWSKSKKTMSIWVDGEREQFHDSKQATAWLFEQIHLTPEILSLMAFYGRGFQTFSRMAPKQRAEMIDMMADGSLWEKAREVCRKEAREKKDEELGLEGRYTEALEASEKLLNQRDEKQEELDAVRVEVEQRRKALEADLVEIRDLHKTIRADRDRLKGERETKLAVEKKGVDEVEEELQKAQAALSGFGESEEGKGLRRSQTEHKKLLAREAALLREADLLESQVAAKEKDLASVEVGICPTCGQSLEGSGFDKDAATEAAAELRAKFHNTAEELTEVQKEEEVRHREIVSAEANEKNYHDAVSVMQGKLSEANRRLASLYERSPEEVTADEDCRTAEIEIDEAEKELKSLDADEKVRELTAQVKLLQASLEEGTDKAKEIAKEAGAARTERVKAEYWQRGFKDIRFSLFEKSVKILEDVLNGYCQQQGLDFDRLEVEAFRETATGSTVAEVNMSVVRGGKALSLEAMSEGETQRIDLACFFALSTLLEKSLGEVVELKVLDEPLSGLDQQGKQAVFDIVSDIAGSRQVFVIDHDSNFQDLFSSVLCVEKRGTSTVAPGVPASGGQ